VFNHTPPLYSIVQQFAHKLLQPHKQDVKGRLYSTHLFHDSAWVCVAPAIQGRPEVRRHPARSIPACHSCTLLATATAVNGSRTLGDAADQRELAGSREDGGLRGGGVVQEGVQEV